MRVRVLQRLLAPTDEGGDGGGGKPAERDPKLFGDEVDPALADLEEEEEEEEQEEEEQEELEALDKDGKPAKPAKPIPGDRAREMVAKAEDRARKKMQGELDALKDQLARVAGQGRDRGADRASPVQQLRLMEAKRDELDASYEELVFAGKKDEARAVRVQMRQLETSISDYKVELRSVAAQRGAADDVRYQVQLDLIEGRYPELNPEHDDYDKDKEDEVSVLVDGLVAKGLAKDLALKRAVKYVLGERREGGKKDEGELDPKTARAVEARKRAAAAARATPENSSNLSKATDGKEREGVDLSKRVSPQTFQKYAKLDEREKARLRGDTA